MSLGMPKSLCSVLAAVAVLMPTAKADEGSIHAADGSMISYSVEGIAEPALVFVHCWACNRDFWREQTAAFAADHTVVALDLPGHGASGRDREVWTLDAYADDVVAVVEALGLDRVVLVGHSMGGPVSLLAAAKLEGRVEGVICADTLHDAEFEMPEDAMQGWLQAFEADYEAGMRQGIEGMVPNDSALREWIAAEAMKADRDAMMALIPAFAGFDLGAALEAADVPVRCINAVPYGPYAIPTAVETNRQHGDFDAVLMDGVGHYLQLERPDEFNTNMRALLEELSNE